MGNELTRKVDASAGAEWILAGFGLLKRSPMGLGVLGLIFGAIAGVFNLVGSSNTTIYMVMQVAMMLIGPILVGGMIWAAREVDQGRGANPSHLMQSLQDGKFKRLWVTLLPQLAGGLLLGILFAIMIGPEQITKMAETMQAAQGQANPDPNLFAGFPVGRFMLWFLIAMLIGVAILCFTFTAIPDIMFTQTGAIDALKRSFRACTRNLPAMLVFLVLLIISVFGIGIISGIVGAIAGAVGGQHVSQMVMQIVVGTVLFPVIAGAMYAAWKQLVAPAGGNDAAPPQLRNDTIEL